MLFETPHSVAACRTDKPRDIRLSGKAEDVEPLLEARPNTLRLCMEPGGRPARVCPALRPRMEEPDLLWASDRQFFPWPFDKEAELETAILNARDALFGSSRIYLDVKKLIGHSGKTQNVPDGYILDLTSTKRPALYLVEVELAKHDPLRHIAQQLLNFSLSFKSTPQKMKSILRDTLQKDADVLAPFEQYATQNGFGNIDYLLEQMIYRDDAFQTIVIIDELEDELERILRSSLAFPVEILVMERFRAATGEVMYRFDPFLYDLSLQSNTTASDGGNEPAVDPSEIDTIVVPARDAGFKNTFLGENHWRAIRIHQSMIPKIRHIAAYRVAPISAITHIAEVERIEPWKDSGKFAVIFKEPAQEITPIKWVPAGKVAAPQSSRYTSFKRLSSAKSLDEVF
jgi:hypothetical protein